MNLPVLTFFNNKGGVGKTSLVYHLAWMYASLCKRVVVIDLDPQANLTAAFLEEECIEKIWNTSDQALSIYHCVKPLADVGDITEPGLQKITSNLYLLPGDVELSSYEDILSANWPNSLSTTNLYRPMRILSSFWQVIQKAAQKINADIILVDIGPNLGAINRSVLIATNYVIIPLGADLFSLQGLKNLGPTLGSWRKEWSKRLSNWEENGDRTKYAKFQLPQGQMQPIGYLCQQYGVRLDRPVKAYDKWVSRIPGVYRKAILNDVAITDVKVESDPYCLATIKHYRSLIPMAQEKRKPIFNLTAADGAIGGHANTVRDARGDFENLAKKIAGKIRLEI